MRVLVALVALFALALEGTAGAAPVVLRDVELIRDGRPTVRLQLSEPTSVRTGVLAAHDGAPPRIYLDLAGTTLAPAAPRSVDGGGTLLRVRAGQFDLETTRVVLDLARETEFTLSADGATVVLQLAAGAAGRPAPSPTARFAPTSRSLTPTTSGHRLTGTARDVGTRPRPPARGDRIIPAPALPPVQIVAPPTTTETATATTSGHDLTAASRRTVRPPRRLAVLSPAPTPLVVARAPEPQPPAEPAPALPAPTVPAPEPEPAPRTAQRSRTPPETVVVVDAGHGGRDPGAAGVGGVLEKDLVLALAHRFAQRLLTRLPVSVILTRADDSFVPIDRRLAQPGDQTAVFISLHANACEDASARGLEVFYGGGLRPAGTPDVTPRAALLGRALGHALDARIGGLRGEARPGDFGVLVRNPIPSALVEVGYLTHPEEAARTQDGDFQELLVDALVDGVSDFLRASSPRL